MPANVRRAVFAGSWYPSGAAECEREIQAFIASGPSAPASVPRAVGGIVPHAGWYYSGSLACRVIHRLSRAETGRTDAVVVFGMHLHRHSANVLMPRGAWQTPFGELPVAEELAAELAPQFPFELETPERFSPDNTVELQLPFIKYFFPEARLLALGVAPAPSAAAIGGAVAAIARRQGVAIKVIGSSDLTHYGPNYGFTPRGSGRRAVDWARAENDRRVIAAMTEMDPERVIAEAQEGHSACCPGAVAAAISAARSLGADSAELIGYASSYDRSPGESFVGYVGMIF
jgi:hypothetical protein